MRVVTVVGVRPEFVMAMPVSRGLEGDHEEVLVHTGQHYDEKLSALFFRELSLPRPAYELGVGSAPRVEQLRRMTARVESVLERERPDLVLVYGDTNSTLAGALAAARHGTPLVHVEAGVRSFDRSMPEERNRVATDRLADLCLAPTDAAVTNLSSTDVRGRVRLTGDVRRDALALVGEATTPHEPLPDTPDEYAVATVHRAGTVSDPATLRSVFRGLASAATPVVVPLHPNTASRLRNAGFYSWAASRLHLVDPVGYPAFVRLLEDARCVATDSGGIQREATMLGTPCVTLREHTEWPETVARGRNVLVGTDADAVRRGLDRGVARPNRAVRPTPGAVERIVEALEAFHDEDPERVASGPVSVSAAPRQPGEEARLERVDETLLEGGDEVRSEAENEVEMRTVDGVGPPTGGGAELQTGGGARVQNGDDAGRGA